MPFASPKKRRKLEQRISSVRSQLAKVKQTRDHYREQRDILREQRKVAFSPRLLLAQPLSGLGIEIGALHNPQPLPPWAEARFVDFNTREQNIVKYHGHEEVDPDKIVETHHLGDGEKLEMLEAESQDFVIANHMLEHCKNPILTIENFLRVTRPGGRIFLSVPDKRFTFDWQRPITPFSHILEDYKNNIQIEPLETYQEWQKLVRPKAIAQKMFENQSNIHFHTWTQTEIMEMYFRIQTDLHFPVIIESMISHGNETCAMLRKGRINDETGFAS